ncbi:MAG: RNA polymerase sigma factor [Microscillaceae bacterium]|nr:RNA polymerase sigma factor [Microscillaceae bacterium]
MSEQMLIDWYSQYFSTLFNYGVQISNNRELVKDCIQEVFITLKLNPHLFCTIQSPKAYLFTVLRRNIIKELKRESVSLDVYSFNAVLDIEPSHESLLIHEQIDLDFKYRLAKALKKLTNRQREAIFLKFYEGLSYQEVAETMQLQDIKSARNLIYKAIKQLKSDFEINGVSMNLYILLSILLLS